MIIILSVVSIIIYTSILWIEPSEQNFLKLGNIKKKKT